MEIMLRVNRPKEGDDGFSEEKVEEYDVAAQEIRLYIKSLLTTLDSFLHEDSTDFQTMFEKPQEIEEDDEGAKPEL